MKKIILILLVSLGLQTQAQIIPCDSIVITGSQTQIQMNIYNFNVVIYLWQTMANDFQILGEDSISNTHNIWNYNPMTSIPYDTITTCIMYGPLCVACCITFVWNGTSWFKMGAITGVEEIKSNNIDNKIYDLLGRELIEIPKNKMYIKNNKIYLND